MTREDLNQNQRNLETFLNQFFPGLLEETTVYQVQSYWNFFVEYLKNNEIATKEAIDAIRYNETALRKLLEVLSPADYSNVHFSTFHVDTDNNEGLEGECYEVILSTDLVILVSNATYYSQDNSRDSSSWMLCVKQQRMDLITTYASVKRADDEELINIGNRNKLVSDHFELYKKLGQ
jgi:hypothetical protein